MKRALTTTACTNAKPGKNPKAGSPQGVDYKMTDGGGLYLFVTARGAKVWRYNYLSPITGKERTMTLGAFPEVSLDKARTTHDAAHAQVKAGKDPMVEEVRTEKKASRVAAEGASHPFREVAAEWKQVKYSPKIRAPKTIAQKQLSIDKLNAAFGELDVKELDEVAFLSDVLTTIELKENYATRVAVQRDAIAIMGYAVAKGWIKINPFAGVKFAAAYTSPLETEQKRPAIIDRAAFAKLLADIDNKIVIANDKRTRHHEVTRRALRLGILIAVRPGELRQIEWERDIDWEAAKLTVPWQVLKQRTKRKLARSPRAGMDFEVPLSRQALEELRELHKLTGHAKHVFPARPSRWGDAHQVKDKPVGENVFNAALVRIGYQGIHCAHGSRSSFSTMMNAELVTVRTLEGEEIETHRFPDQKALIEVQLDHDDASTQAIYDRGGRWAQRAKLMQFWADRVDQMRGVKVETTRYPRPRLVA
jgi:integrase